jgi:hypothetical protein
MASVRAWYCALSRPDAHRHSARHHALLPLQRCIILLDTEGLDTYGRRSEPAQLGGVSGGGMPPCTAWGAGSAGLVVMSQGLGERVSAVSVHATSTPIRSSLIARQIAWYPPYWAVWVSISPHAPRTVNATNAGRPGPPNQHDLRKEIEALINSGPHRSLIPQPNCGLQPA